MTIEKMITESMRLHKEIDKYLNEMIKETRNMEFGSLNMEQESIIFNLKKMIFMDELSASSRVNYYKILVQLHDLWTA